MSIRVLLVDDHQIMREGLRAIVEKGGKVDVVGESEDGREAVEMAGRLVPDVVIMDVAMPDMNGIEATRQIKKNTPGIEVIALSTYSDKRYVLNMIAAGVSAYVLKEAASDDLLRAVDAVTKGRRYLSPAVTGVVIENSLRAKAGSASTAYTELGSRERQVLQLLAEGYTSPQIASRLNVTTKTVESHRRNIMQKLDLHSVAELTKYAVREGLTSLES